MFESEHTPVPWQVVQSDKLLYICDGAGNSIPQSWATDPIAVGNVYRMAAAPELLDALERMVRDPHDEVNILTAHLVIAKAKGELDVH